METSNFLEKGNIPNEANNSGCNWMKFGSLAVLVVLALVVVPVLVVCFLFLHGQSPETCWAHATYPTQDTDGSIMWQWNFTDCSSFVRNGFDQKLEVLQDGMYFIYAQVTRETKTESYFTMFLYKDPYIPLNHVTGPNTEAVASINFGRPYFLSKGEKLFCSINDGLNHIQKDNQTYWGLYKM